MEIGYLHRVVVDDGEPARAPGDEGDRGGRADAARADEHHVGHSAHRKYSSRLK